jgi:UDP-GlcNAc3NAcA epimerase
VSKKIKILSIIGARPQFVKAAALTREFSKHNRIQEVTIHTGQHFDKNMSEIFFDEMGIPEPKYNLGINSVSHGQMTGRMLESIEGIMLKEKPQLTLVYGDTNSTLAGALAAKKLHIKLAHVEAGLRSFNMNMPEEINRILTDRISDYLFCPTSSSVENLKNEGFESFESEVFQVGDVMLDCANYYSSFSHERSTLPASLTKEKFILCTVHREESTNNPEKLREIINALNEINKSISVIVPLHPRTKKILHNLNIIPQFTCIEPIGYFNMIRLIEKCELVITDSGGLQKEAYFFRKNCVTLRDETEWTELVDNGTNSLVGCNQQLIIKTTERMLKQSSNFDSNLYGKGKASQDICNHILRIHG